MIFNAAKPFDRHKAIERLKWLIDRNKMFEIKEKHRIRTISQNSYLHLILSWFAVQTGYTADEVKQEIFKKVVNPNLFYDGEFDGLVKIERWRSTASLDKEEMTLAITRFRNWSSSVAGIYLPSPDDLPLLDEIRAEISKIEVQTYL